MTSDRTKEPTKFIHLSIMEEVENLASTKDNQEYDDDEVDDDMFLPGFRFHPTDEELVGFYLLRKVQNRLVTLDFIKQIDIYKFDPWDLPKTASSVGENEWYFFCKRGRKYKNSIRPNRVTGSGFWKATGIDRPIYAAGHRHCCIGLKKSLVYYRGSAGKGTKTEWMMHEFRLPPQHQKSSAAAAAAIPTHPKNIAQEAEVWTLCRILKRKSMLEWKELTAVKRNSNPSAETCSKESSLSSNLQENYISFSNPLNVNNVITKHSHDEERPFGISVNNVGRNDNVDYHIIYGSHHQQINNNQVSQSRYPSYPPPAAANSLSSFTSATPEIINGFPKHADWEELRSVFLGFATDP